MLKRRNSKEVIEKKERGAEYLWLALYAFLGLGCEVILAYGIEPLLYGHEMSAFTTKECILHWCMTCIIWLAFVYFIIRYAKKNLDFTVKGKGEKVTLAGWLICGLFIVFITLLNIHDTGTLKPYHEFVKLGLLKGSFQHLYYLVETMLFTLIIIFGQIAMEKWTKRKNVPFGGIVVGCTWGLSHMFTKSSVIMGVEGLLLGFLFGTIYLLMKRNVPKTYLVLALAFIL